MKYRLLFLLLSTTSVVFSQNERIETPPSTSIEVEEAEGEVMIREEIIDLPDESPEFPGGKQGFNQFIRENLTYPEEAQEMAIQGRVYVQFIVEKDGSITSAKIRRGVDKLLDQEALRLIELMPKWKPGTVNGNPIRTRTTLPIRFLLTE